MLRRCRGKRGGSNKVAKRDDGGIAKERSRPTAQVRAVCPDISSESYNEYALLLRKGHGVDVASARGSNR
jgi:hypothetical protein